jgi:hypothetical protein
MNNNKKLFIVLFYLVIIATHAQEFKTPIEYLNFIGKEQMAIRQISRITHRKGLSENLPQLAGAELGWVVDDRKLYIGNGTLTEGAPEIGNTEILTEFSDILGAIGTYTYQGTEGGYTVQTGPTSTDPSSRTVQLKLDDFASVKDFGAKGDGNTDDTEAINRALYQLFCVQASYPGARRSLFFPAGEYLVSDSVLIPPYAKIWGEGANSTIIRLIVSLDGSSMLGILKFSNNY